MRRTDMTARVDQRHEPWDMVVIGGGATGVGIAVDAASRGYDVLLLEQHDPKVKRRLKKIGLGIQRPAEMLDG